jgi:hypothetical protein
MSRKLKFGGLTEVVSKPKGKIRNLINFARRESKMGDVKCNVLQYTGTNGQAEKHSLQRCLEIVKKTCVKNGYVC